MFARLDAPPPDSPFLADADDSGANGCTVKGAGYWVMGGCDVVEYGKLAASSTGARDGEFNCTAGSAEFAVSVNGFNFAFASAGNAELFNSSAGTREQYAPAWGGFCAYGVSGEDWWTAADMSAQGNPNVWSYVNGRLFTFRGREPQRKFLEGNVTGYMAAGDRIWQSWIEEWGESPVFNTDCFHY